MKKLKSLYRKLSVTQARHSPRKLFFILLSLFWVSLPGFSQQICLTENEFHELMNIIRISRMNSKQQQELITELRETLAAQEAGLREALGSMELSEADLTELKASLSRIRTYSEELNKYCGTLENEINRLRKINNNLKIGIGITGGAAGILTILFVILMNL
jgi:uncharacterized membrane protein YtjA (UPF0391 family)